MTRQLRVLVECTFSSLSAGTRVGYGSVFESGIVAGMVAQGKLELPSERKSEANRCRPAKVETPCLLSVIYGGEVI